MFNLGEYRRQMEGYDKPSHEFFDHSNPEGVKIRKKVCDEALKDMFSWIEDKVRPKIVQQIFLVSFNTNIFAGRDRGV